MDRKTIRKLLAAGAVAMVLALAGCRNPDDRFVQGPASEINR